MEKQNQKTWIFIGFLLVAGMSNVLCRMVPLQYDKLLTCISDIVYCGLLMFWVQSVRERLLPSAARRYVLGAGFLMLMNMLNRIIKYRFLVEPAVIRYFVYAYWIPQTVIPALFLMNCIRIRNRSGKHFEKFLLIPVFLLVVTVLTNDLHGLVYRPLVSMEVFAGDTGTFVNGPVLYALYAWMAVTMACGLVILFVETGRVSGGAIRMLTWIVVLWVVMIALNFLVFDSDLIKVKVFNVPETHIFGMLGVFETCIRYRLIPYNENYTGFFHALQLPVLIADRSLKPVYRSQAELNAEEETLKAALESPVNMADDQVLHGKEINAGYAFWMEDESGIRKVQERLRDANEVIEQENDLIKAETEQKERDAFLQSRHHIYHEIAEVLYPCQKRIGQLLEQALPGTDGFKEIIAEVSVLNAYVKRKTNLLFLASESDCLSLHELFLALRESADYLTLAGLQTTAGIPNDRMYPAEMIIGLYDAFETIAEQLIGKAPSLMVSWNGESLRLAAETDTVPDIDCVSRTVRILKSEDVLYMDILVGKDGDPA